MSEPESTTGAAAGPRRSRTKVILLTVALGCVAVAAVVYFVFFRVPTGLEMKVLQTSWSLWVRNESNAPWPAGTKIRLHVEGKDEPYEVTFSRPFSPAPGGPDGQVIFYAAISYQAFRGVDSGAELSNRLKMILEPGKVNVKIRSLSVEVPGAGVRSYSSVPEVGDDALASPYEP